MMIVRTIGELRFALAKQRANGWTVGFAPTMGALHDGHRSLMEAASWDGCLGVASIFVNPLQFAAGEDLDSYPRTLDADAAMAEEAGISYVFAPSAVEMYPEPSWTTVSLDVVTEPWEGESRPTHFAGVATVMTKLLSIVGPCRAYFGEKDYQQLAMLRRMAYDLNLDAEIIGMPTIREDDGLAMSSRNRRLTPEHRAEAPIVSQALRLGIAAIDAGETNPATVEALIRDALSTAPSADAPDYVAVVDANSLRTPDHLTGEVRVLTAVRFGDVRLIDNMGTLIS
ncbi:MAG: pantoate--beta-alanine ligase [Acidimicrobiales bacterium]|nr:MAG: pantoate--beta-alanine ligase [Acidimicrobiales bacterium]